MSLSRAISLTVNGAVVSAVVEGATHLADFLREQRDLTGTHLGCEHGVCGACTVLIDGEPARSCITLAAACDGAEVRTVEGLDDDPVTTRLRAAFKIDHGLQCGYCTPGMLVTARDIVRRLPQADEARIRLELSGNLCRCTGYAGIVRAIRRVLADPPPLVEAARAPVAPQVSFAHPTTVAPPIQIPPPAAIGPSPGTGLQQTLRLAVPIDTVWQAVKDPALIAACVPGVELTHADATNLTGGMVVGLGPIRARFQGRAALAYQDAERAGTITGEGRDATTGTLLRATAGFRVTSAGPAETIVALSIDYQLRGALAQFGRGAVVQALAQELTRQVAHTLEARLRGDPTAPAAPPRLSAGRLVWATIRHRLSRWFGVG
ncbi:MAG TPA: 2Fe-2S iron-sulfur cluster-binding protein [Stellaceae bacterium]|nr:2Fe-2S iron-sulfur cluster-binding protein [Stellaceae bacterium]